MTGVIGLAVRIAALTIISSLVFAITGSSRSKGAIRTVVTLAVITAIVGSVSEIKPDGGLSFDLGRSEVNENDAWDSTLGYLEDRLEGIFYDHCRQNGLYVDGIEVSLTHSGDVIDIIRIVITGRDSSSAKNIIAGHFKISPAYILINGD